jgi:streptogramin lyase
LKLNLTALILVVFLVALTFSISASIAQQNIQVETLLSKLNHPTGIAVDEDGRIFFTEFAAPRGKLWLYDPATGSSKILMSNLTSPSSVAVFNGKVYVAESGEGRLWVYSLADNSSEVLLEGYAGIWGVSVSQNGTIYFTIKSTNGKLFRLKPEGGEPELLASNLNVPYGLDVASNGDVFFVEFGRPMVANGTLKVFRIATGDVQTILENLYNPYDVALFNGKVYFTNRAGKVYVLESESEELSVLAEGFKRLYGLDVDQQGNIYLAEFGSPVSAGGGGDGTIKKIVFIYQTRTSTTTPKETVTVTETQTLTETVTITAIPKIHGMLEDLKSNIESLAGSLQAMSWAVWIALALAVLAVAAALAALFLTLRFRVSK